MLYVPSAAMRMSAHIAISSPPPRQCPLIAQTTIFGVRSNLPMISFAWMTNGELVLAVGRREHLHVRAGREELLRRAAHDDGLDRGVEARLVDRERQVVKEGLVVRVGRRPVQHDVPDGIP